MQLIRLHAGIVGERNNWIIPRLYTDLLGGDFVAAQVLKECVFWTAWSREQHPERDGWFWRSEAEWRAEGGVSRKQLVRAIGTINGRIEGALDPEGEPLLVIERGLRKIGGAPTMHFRVTDQGFALLLEGESILPDGTNRSGPEGQNDPAERAESLHTQVTAPETTPESKRSPERKRDRGETEDFIAFYEAYPRKRARGDAWRAWRSIDPSPELAAEIMAAIEEQRRTSWAEADPQFIPYPASWLRAERWKDEIEAAPASPARAGSRPADDTEAHWFGRYAKGGRS